MINIHCKNDEVGITHFVIRHNDRSQEIDHIKISLYYVLICIEHTIYSMLGSLDTPFIFCLIK